MVDKEVLCGRRMREHQFLCCTCEKLTTEQLIATVFAFCCHEPPCCTGRRGQVFAVPSTHNEKKFAATKEDQNTWTAGSSNLVDQLFQLLGDSMLPLLTGVLILILTSPCLCSFTSRPKEAAASWTLWQRCAGAEAALRCTISVETHAVLSSTRLSISTSFSTDECSSKCPI